MQMIINNLLPSVDEKRLDQWVRIPIDIDEKEGKFAIMYTDLDKANKESIDIKQWERIADTYDQIISEEVSKLGGK
jgi:hypothetical protein